MSETFSPEEHKFAQSKYFEDLKIGEQFYIPSRTLTEASFAAFQMASGDNHPLSLLHTINLFRGNGRVIEMGKIATY